MQDDPGEAVSIGIGQGSVQQPATDAAIAML